MLKLLNCCFQHQLCLEVAVVAAIEVTSVAVLDHGDETKENKIDIPGLV
jgi:hypothetical protein